MRIVIFGTGIRYERNKKWLMDDEELVALLDNDQFLWNSYIDNVKVYSPEKIKGLDYDCVLLMSRYAAEMREQLLGYGVANDKIWEWGRYAKAKLNDVVCMYGNQKLIAEKRAMLITNDLGYNGAAMACVYAAYALVYMGYDVVIAASCADERLKQEILERGIYIAVAPGLPYLDAESKLYNGIEKYDFVLANALPMMNCVCELGKTRNVAWWLHECKYPYPKMSAEIELLKNEINFSHVKVCAVSKSAENNFKEYFPEANVSILPYGIPDERMEGGSVNAGGKLVIALVGGINKRKAQDILLDAVELLSEDERRKIEVWLIGRFPGANDEYGQKIRSMLADKPEVRLMGVMDRKEITEAYGKIDVVVCPSREETMSIALTEGMMHGKVCISSDASVVGMADYIQDGYNGLVFEHENALALAEKLSWVISHRESMDEMGKRARRTYEEYFSMESFEERLLGVTKERK